MSDSDFNMGATVSGETLRETPLPIRSTRYLYFKSMRHGLLNFVKRPSPEYISDMLTVEALRKEFLLCFPLSHPSLVRYVAFENSSLYEEFVDGMTLREMIDCDDRRLRNPRFLLTFARQLFNVLDYIHRQGILHLDIKPENLMITRIGDSLKLIDFSCALSAVSNNTAGFTSGYKAPEQGKTADSCATDLYLAGKVVELLAKICSVSPKWKSFVSKATASDPSQRFQSAEEALSALPDKDKDVGMTRVYIYGAGILVVLIVGMLISWSNYKSHPSPKLIEPAITRNITDTPPSSDSILTPTQPQASPTPTPPHSEIITKDAVFQEESKDGSKSGTSPQPAREAVYPDHVYLVGNVEGNLLDPQNGIQVNGKNGIYTGEFEFTKSTHDDYSYFLLAEKLGNTWDNAGAVWSSNSQKPDNTKAAIIEEGQTAQYNIHEDVGSPYRISPGKYALRFDLNNARLTITRRSN